MIMKKIASMFLFATAVAFLFTSINGCKKSSDDPAPVVTTVTDADGNVYNTVVIGAQTWMVENLKTTKFNDGTAIPVVEDGTWGDLSSAAMCWYNNDVSNKLVYGGLYNWFAVNSGKLAPAGWHVATDEDWITLIFTLEGETVAGGKLKSTGTLESANGLWLSPNTGATNTSGFKGYPGGYRGSLAYNDINAKGHWWTTLENGVSTAWGYELHHDSIAVFRQYNLKTEGRGVRCVKN